MKTLNQLKRLHTFPADTVYDEIDSPVGRLVIFASLQGVHSILWAAKRFTTECNASLADIKHSPRHEIITETKKQLKEYFQGKRTEFDLPLAAEGTPFQQQVWQELSKIPYGKTISYGEQARRLGDKNKARAVGMANGLNPIPIIVPCHRVIGSNGSLTGFASGIEKKKFLLELEKQTVAKKPLKFL